MEDVFPMGEPNARRIIVYFFDEIAFNPRRVSDVRGTAD